jgi:hypothetical protein
MVSRGVIPESVRQIRSNYGNHFRRTYVLRFPTCAPICRWAPKEFLVALPQGDLAVAFADRSPMADWTTDDFFRRPNLIIGTIASHRSPSQIDVDMQQRTFVRRPPIEVAAMGNPLDDLPRYPPATFLLVYKPVAFTTCCKKPLIRSSIPETLHRWTFAAEQGQRSSDNRSDRSETRNIEAMISNLSMLGARRPDSIWRSSLSGSPHNWARSSCVSPHRVRSA